MKKRLYLTIITIMLLFTSCENYFAKQWGGKLNIELKENEKFINATWKDNNIWILTQDKINVKQYTLKEYSNTGILNGSVIINEK